MNSQQHPLILIVDDDNSIRTLLKLAIKNKGYRVQEAKNGEEGIAVYQCCQPDLVILDAVMPVMDGFTCCEHIREITQENDKEIPILMLTFLDDKDSIDKAFKAGATDYITKPIYWEVLFQRLHRLLKAYKNSIDAQKIASDFQQLAKYEDLLRTIINSDEFINQDILEKIRCFFNVDRAIFHSVKNKSTLQSHNEQFSPIENDNLMELSLIGQCDNIYQQENLLIISDPENSDFQEKIAPEQITKFTKIFTKFELKSLVIAPIRQKKHLSNLLYLCELENNRNLDDSEKQRIIDITKLLELKT